MAVNAGELRDRVIIQRCSGNRDENGYPKDVVWQNFKIVCAKVTHLSGRDLLAAQAAQSETVARLKLRFRTDIDTSMRVIHKSMIYAINSPRLDDPETGNNYCTFLLSGGVEKFEG